MSSPPPSVPGEQRTRIKDAGALGGIKENVMAADEWIATEWQYAADLRDFEVSAVRIHRQVIISLVLLIVV